MDNLFPLILDGIVLVLLVGTMFFAVRLSIYLKSFRDSRQGLEKLLRDLSDQVDHAERAIDNLKVHARNTGRDLQGAVDDAGHLKDELQIMSEYGDKLAVRLEQLLENRDGVAPKRQPKSDTARKSENASDRKDSDDSGDQMFNIRDIDVDRGDLDDGLAFDADDEEHDGNFSSEAEKDLYNALKKKTKAGGV